MIVLVILTATIIMLIFEVFRIDVVAIICMLALGWTGILTNREMFSGFSSNAVIAMMSVMILSHGIARTGVMDKFSKFAIEKAGADRRRLVGFMSVAVGSLSGFIQNIGAAALFLPGVLQVSRRSRIPASALIMPIGFAAILGGTMTMVGSGPLILVNDLLRNAGLEAYHLFSVTPVGLTLLISGVLFFLLFGNYILPKVQGEVDKKTDQEKLVERLNITHNTKFLTIPASSKLCGQTTEESGIWANYNLNIPGIGKGKDLIYAPWRKTTFEAGQTLIVMGKPSQIKRFSDDFNLQESTSKERFSENFNPEKSGFAEVVIPPASEICGKSLREFALRKRYAVEPLMLFHKGEKVEGDFSDVVINPGDTFVVYGKWEKMIDLKESADFVVVTPIDHEKRDPSKTWLAIGCFLLAILLALIGYPISMAFLTGALCMVFCRIMTINEAYKAIEWKVVFLLAGLIPLGIAMEKTGTAKFMAETIMHYIIDFHPLILVMMVAVLATLFSLFMSNVGAIVVLAPLVMGMAEIAGLDPRPLVLMAAVCAANFFILPTHQVNALLMSAGGYKNADYIKAGGGMTVLFLVVVVSMFYFMMI